jgi:uncharacterized protein YbjT (DUF2867 family)
MSKIDVEQENLILVSGATGNVGRNVVFQLLSTGASVRVLTRNPDSAELPGVVDIVRGDLSAPGTVAASLNGVRLVFLMWPFFTAEGAPVVLDVIKKHARRIVFLSSIGAGDDIQQGTDPIFHADIERLIEQSGLEWTFLRAGGFATNTLWWAPQIRSDGVVRAPYGAAARSLIHERDIAAVAVRALTAEGHVGAKYVLTGPETLTQIEQVHIIGDVIGRPLRYEEISPEAARQQMVTAGMPPSFANRALNYWAKLVTEPELVTSTVEEITGAPTRTFAEWAIDHADDFLSASASGNV